MSIDAELDEIYDEIDELFLNGKFDKVNSILEDLDLENTEQILL